MGNLNCYYAELRIISTTLSLVGSGRARRRSSMHCACNKLLPKCPWLQSTVNTQSYCNLQSQNWSENYKNHQPKSDLKVTKKFKRKSTNLIQICLSKNDNIQIHQYIEISQDSNPDPSRYSTVVIFTYWACQRQRSTFLVLRSKRRVASSQIIILWQQATGGWQPLLY